MRIFFAVAVVSLIISCNNAGNGNNSSKPAVTDNAVAEKTADLYFDYSIDGKPEKVNPDNITTTYNQFSATDREFKIFAGNDNGPQLLLTIVSDMSKASSTPSGSKEAGNKLFQGSVSLQDYPTKGTTLNNYDGFINPKPEPVGDAIIISSSEVKGDKGRIITGSFKTKVENTADKKSIALEGKFRIFYEFKGDKF